MWHVYIITNLANGKIYIGKTNNLKNRWNQHKSYKHSQKNYQRPVYNAIKKYGENNFSKSIIETYDNEIETLQAEIFFILYLKSLGAILYNISPGGEGLSKPCTAASKLKISQALLGKKLSYSRKKNIQLAHLKINHDYTIDPRNTKENKYCPSCNTIKNRKEFYNLKYWCCILCKRKRTKIEKQNKKQNIKQSNRKILNDNIILEILTERSNGKTLGELSDQFNLNRGGLSKICNGITWIHIYNKFHNIK